MGKGKQLSRSVNGTANFTLIFIFLSAQKTKSKFHKISVLFNCPGHEQSLRVFLCIGFLMLLLVLALYQIYLTTDQSVGGTVGSHRYHLLEMFASPGKKTFLSYDDRRQEVPYTTQSIQFETYESQTYEMFCVEQFSNTGTVKELLDGRMRSK